MTPELGLPRPHPPRRPYDTRSHIHTGPLVIVTPQSLTDFDTRLIYLLLYELGLSRSHNIPQSLTDVTVK
jgi:hypothetical protein